MVSFGFKIQHLYCFPHQCFHLSQLSDLLLNTKFYFAGTYGDVHIHTWEEELHANDYARNIIAARITSPAITAGSGILCTAISACSKLRSLRLDSVKYEALYDLKHVSKTLEKLLARVFWPKLPQNYLLDDPQRLGWFNWASCLKNLKFLEIFPLNTPTYIGMKEILENLPAKHLEHLRLCLCVAPADLKAADFKHLNKLKFLSLRHCQFETSEIRTLQSSLPHLYGIECIQRRAKDAHRLLRGKKEPTNTCGISHLHLSLHFSTEESAKFEKLRDGVPKSRQLSSNLKNVCISFSGQQSCVLSLYYPHRPSYISSLPSSLETLTLSSSLGSIERAALHGKLTSLRSISMKYHHLQIYNGNTPPIDSRYLPGLASLQQLTELDLSFHSMEENFKKGVPNILKVFKKLRRLRLDGLKGSAYMLGPVVDMQDLFSFELKFCNLSDLWLLKLILNARSRSLVEFKYSSKGCYGGDSCIYRVLEHAVPEMPRLRKLWVHESATHSLCSDRCSGKGGGKEEVFCLHGLPKALGVCTTLRDLRVSPNLNLESNDIYNINNSPLPVLDWSALAACTRLCNLSICATSGWNLQSFSSLCTSLPYLQDVVIMDYKNLDKSIVDENWMTEISRLPLLRELHLSGCRLLKLPGDLTPLAKAPSLMFLHLLGKGIQHPHAMAERIEGILPNIQRCNVVR
jgi:hypothetical protein